MQSVGCSCHDRPVTDRDFTPTSWPTPSHGSAPQAALPGVAPQVTNVAQGGAYSASDFTIPLRPPLLRQSAAARGGEAIHPAYLGPQAPSAWLAGVAAGVSLHLGLPVAVVRAVFVAGTFAAGLGLLAYVLLWLMMRVATAAEGEDRAVRMRRRLAQPLATGPVNLPGTLTVGGAATLAVGAFAFAISLVLIGTGRWALPFWALPLLLFGGGALLVWSQAEALTSSERDWAAVMRAAAGLALAAVGIFVWLSRGDSPRVMLTGALTGATAMLGLALVLAPIYLSANRAVHEARASEAREAERADIAAHLHDSVLQTLTLIQKRADDPAEVTRLARSQERELRSWLYHGTAELTGSLSTELTELVAEIEDRYSVSVDLVIVGDHDMDDDTAALLAATREALQNAAQHGAPPVSIYAEMTSELLEVFVRDRGSGFDPDEVAEDRHGVRESIFARMERHGGNARIRRLERGVEVQLRLPVLPSRVRSEA